MSADRWNAALEAAADRLRTRACGYLARHDTIYNGRIVSEELFGLAESILALREADQRDGLKLSVSTVAAIRNESQGIACEVGQTSHLQRGAAAEAGLKTGGRLNAPDVDSVGGSVPSAKGSAAIAPSVEASQSAPHLPGGQTLTTVRSKSGVGDGPPPLITSALPGPVPAPGDMVLVPREPTDKMIEAFIEEWFYYDAGKNMTDFERRFASAYAAMLTSAEESRNAT